jgi:hypothetical protein
MEEVMKTEDILNLKIESRDHDINMTIRGYFRELLMELWREGECFSGKRPFGNSGWEHDLYKPLIRAGVIPGELDEDGYIEEVDSQAADKFVLKLIDAALTV